MIKKLSKTFVLFNLILSSCITDSYDPGQEEEKRPLCKKTKHWADVHVWPDGIEIMKRPPYGSRRAANYAISKFEEKVGPFHGPEPVYWWTEDDIVYAGSRWISGLYNKCHLLMEWYGGSFKRTSLTEELGHYVHEYALGDADGGHKDLWWWEIVVPWVDMKLGEWERDNLNGRNN